MICYRLIPRVILASLEEVDLEDFEDVMAKLGANHQVWENYKCYSGVY
jgi:hypothetical protein